MRRKGCSDCHVEVKAETSQEVRNINNKLMRSFAMLRMTGKSRTKGFSLAEVMVSLLVVSIIMAMTLPVMTVRKRSGSGAANTELWKQADQPRQMDIYYCDSGNCNVGIGTKTPQFPLVVADRSDTNFTIVGASGINNINSFWSANMGPSGSWYSAVLGVNGLRPGAAFDSAYAVMAVDKAATAGGGSIAALGVQSDNNNGIDVVTGNGTGIKIWNAVTAIDSRMGNNHFASNVGIGTSDYSNGILSVYGKSVFNTSGVLPTTMSVTSESGQGLYVNGATAWNAPLFPDLYGVAAIGASYGMIATTDGTTSHYQSGGIYEVASGTGWNNYKIFSDQYIPSNSGLLALSSVDGPAIAAINKLNDSRSQAIYSYSPYGYAIYSKAGKNYFKENVGIGTEPDLGTGMHNKGDQVTIDATDDESKIGLDVINNGRNGDFPALKVVNNQSNSGTVHAVAIVASANEPNGMGIAMNVAGSKDGVIAAGTNRYGVNATGGVAGLYATSTAVKYYPIFKSGRVEACNAQNSFLRDSQDDSTIVGTYTQKYEVWDWGYRDRHETYACNNRAYQCQSHTCTPASTVEWKTTYSTGSDLLLEHGTIKSNTGTTIYLSGTGYASDVHLKKDIKTIKANLSKILSLNSVSFKWKTKEELPKDIKEFGVKNEEPTTYGFIAQEVEKIIPDLVTISPNGIKSINYNGVIPLCVGAIQELNKKIDDLAVSTSAILKQVQDDLKGNRSDLKKVQEDLAQIKYDVNKIKANGTIKISDKKLKIKTNQSFIETVQDAVQTKIQEDISSLNNDVSDVKQKILFVQADVKKAFAMLKQVKQDIKMLVAKVTGIDKNVVQLQKKNKQLNDKVYSQQQQIKVLNKKYDDLAKKVDKLATVK